MAKAKIKSKKVFRKCLQVNKGIFEESEKIIPKIMRYAADNGLNGCNSLSNNKPYEYLVCSQKILEMNKENQGPDAKDKDENVWEIKCIGDKRDTDNNGLNFSFQNFETFEELEEWFFKKVEGDPFGSGKLSGGLLACRKLPLSEGFGFSEIIECNMKDVWDNLLREKIKKDFKSGKRFSSSIDYNKLKSLIVGENISGKVYNRKQIKSFEKNLSKKQGFLFNKVDELIKLFSKVWVARQNKYRLEFEQGINPLAKNDLNEFRASIRTNSLMLAGIGPDAIDENKNYYEFKVLGGAKLARIDWGSVLKTWKKFFDNKVVKKFMWEEKSVRYFIFRRKGQKFVDCYVAKGSELLGNEENVKRIKNSYNTLGDRKTKKVYLSLSFLNNDLFKKVELDKVLDVSWD